MSSNREESYKAKKQGGLFSVDKMDPKVCCSLKIPRGKNCIKGEGDGVIGAAAGSLQIYVILKLRRL